MFDRLHRISSAPFADEHLIKGPTLKDAVGQKLAFFPILSKFPERRSYELDSLNSVREDDSCTKKSHGYPSLISGIFTVNFPHS